MTGSVNQLGEVQAVGAVTTKIEGHYAVCKAHGLTGEQGVVIPAANVSHLMLKQEVVDAVAGGKFHVWAIGSIEEGIELLTGIRAGRRERDGAYPHDTIHGRIERRLAERQSKWRGWVNDGRCAPIRSSSGRAAPTEEEVDHEHRSGRLLSTPPGSRRFRELDAAFACQKLIERAAL